MPVQNLKYCEYFDVNEKYFPCIDESAINSGAAWDTTYPHQTFATSTGRRRLWKCICKYLIGS